MFDVYEMYLYLGWLSVFFFFFLLYRYSRHGFCTKGKRWISRCQIRETSATSARHMVRRVTSTARGVVFSFVSKRTRARKRGTRFCFLFERRTFKWPSRWNYRLERSCVESSCPTPSLEQCVPLQACFYPRGQFIPRDSRWIDISSPSRLKRRNKCQGIAVFTLRSRYIYVRLTAFDYGVC